MAPSHQQMRVCGNFAANTPWSLYSTGLGILEPCATPNQDWALYFILQIQMALHGTPRQTFWGLALWHSRVSTLYYHIRCPESDDGAR